MQIAVPKGKDVSGSFYKNVVLKNKTRKIRPKAGLQHVHLLHDNAPAHCSSAVAQLLKSEKVNVLSHTFCSPDLVPCDFFHFPKLKKKKPKNTYLVGDIGPEVHWGLRFTSFLWIYPKMSMKLVSKKWIKRLKRCVLAKGEYFEDY